MATHQLYLGGSSNNNFNRSMFPAPAFDATVEPFLSMPIAEHKKTTIAALTRALNFGTAQGRPNDPALQEYVRNHPIVAADVMTLAVIPANVLVLGFYCSISNPSGKVGTLTFDLNDGTTIGAAVNINSAFHRMCAPNGAWVAAGPVSLATADFSNVARILRATVTTLATDFGALQLSISPILLALESGGP